MTDGSHPTGTDANADRLGEAEPPADGDPDRADQHASADVAPELFGW